MRRWYFACLLVVLLSLSVGGFSAIAQEGEQEEINRAAVTAWALYARNDHLLELNRLIYSEDGYTYYSPFNPAGALTSADEVIAGEEAFLTAFPDMHFTDFIVLAEGNLTAFIGYQRGTFTETYYGAEATGEVIEGPFAWISEFDPQTDRVIREFNAWDQQAFFQDLGWTEDLYDYTSEPWDVSLGTTTTTPTANHNLINRLAMSAAAGSVDGFGEFYAPDAVAHDYMRDLVGVEAIAAFNADVFALPGFTAVESRAVCEGDLCAMWGLATVDGDPDPVGLTWFSLYRFADGMIAEEWMLYDNLVLWSYLDPLQ